MDEKKDSYRLKHEKAIRDEKFKQLELDKERAAEEERQIKKLAKEREAADKNREIRNKNFERLESEITKQKEEQAKLDDILIGNAKEKFAIDQKIKIVAAELKRLNELGEEASQDDILNVKKRLAELKESKKVLESINNAQLESLEHADKEQVLLYDIKSSKKDILKIDKHINELKSGRLDLSKEETKKLLKEANAQKGLLENNILLANETQQIQVVLDKSLGILNTSVGALQSMSAAAKAFTAAMAANPIMFALTAALAAAIYLFGDLIGSAKGFNESLGTSASQSLKLSKNITISRNALKLLGVDGDKVASGLVENFGTLSTVTSENVLQIGMMERTLGIASNDTAKFAKSFTSLTGESVNTAINTAKMAANLAESNDVAPGKVMADIASSTEEFAAYGKDGGANLVKAAISARKLGLEMGTLTKITDSLLDFESSIAAEMEASMLIGKQLNYNKARELALQGDIAGAAKNVMDQVGGAAEFQKMNVIQRRALAASIGVSVEEMSKLASGKLEIKDDKTDAEKLKDANNANTDQLGKSIAAMGKLTIAIGVLTAVMAAGTIAKFFKGGGFKDMFSKMGKSKFNPMNIGRKTALDGSFKGSSKGTISKTFTKVKNMKMPKLGIMDKGKAALDTIKGTGRGALEAVKNIRMPKLDLMSKGKTALDAVKGVKNVGAVSKLLKFGNMAKGGIGSLVGGLALDYGRGKLEDQDSTLGKSMGIGSATLSGAGTGAMIGSVIPGVGTAVGGAVGGAIGAAMGAWSEYGEQLKSWWGGKSKAEETKAAMEKQTEAIKIKTAEMQAQIAVKEAEKLKKEQEHLKKQEEERKKKAEADKAQRLAKEKQLAKEKADRDAAKKVQEEAKKTVKTEVTKTKDGGVKTTTTEFEVQTYESQKQQKQNAAIDKLKREHNISTDSTSDEIEAVKKELALAREKEYNEVIAARNTALARDSVRGRSITMREQRDIDAEKKDVAAIDEQTRILNMLLEEMKRNTGATAKLTQDG